MLQGFITIRVLDIIDILLVAYLMYQVYLLIRGTVAMNIFIGILSVYLVWIIVKALEMQLLGTILGQVIGVGVIALIIVFQQEVRRFLIFIGNQYFNRNRLTLEKVIPFELTQQSKVRIKSVIKAVINMAKSKTGALIVISKKSELTVFAETGDRLNADTTSRLIESIFNKNSPLHDGAMIITGDKLIAARCVLPVSDNLNLPPNYGMRHRAALGMSENTDSLVIIVSEETGQISFAESGKLQHNIDPKDLMAKLELNFG
ncbi:MAG TPA: TIGR00159 family protein [Bacteroides sp.]|nr:TIGR00159 family protein [Bacteroides sp.]